MGTAGGEKKAFLTNHFGKKGAKAAVILFAAILGLSLLLVGGRTGEGKKDENQDVSKDLEQYAKSVEQKLYDICSKVDGVSNVSVAVSFECGFEYVYAREDGAGKFLVVGSGSSESAVRVTEKTPIIGGIGVVCKGGGDPKVQKKLINLISAAFGVGSNKIYITEASK